MKRTLILGLGLVSTLGINTAFAQQGRTGPPAGAGHGPQGRKPHGPGPLLRALDADADGTISAEEIADAADALLDLDSNGDGALTRDELRPPRRPAGAGDQGEQGHAGGPRDRGAPSGSTPDDGGFTSLEEFLAPAEARFELMDSDGDGFVSLDEHLAPAEEHFARLDLNDDGEIDPTESQAAPRRPRRMRQTSRPTDPLIEP